ncbi:MAG: TraR/DksA C4-type zinc finger protein [Thermodesulfovibrionales bacterium]|nr:TraR/DksA C4-type zinc finger protein [Thermodesulfovibrionales bacterium]
MKSKGKPKKPLSERDIKIMEIKKHLILQRNKLLADAGIALNSLPSDNTLSELGDQASVEIDRNFMLKLKERERKLLKKIEKAIEKIDKNEYGICEACGQLIDIKRLEARPVTDLCIECKTEQEEEEKLKEKS